MLIFWNISLYLNTIKVAQLVMKFITASLKKKSEYFEDPGG